jgi:cathepsin L
MESCYAILHGKGNLTVFSPQQIVDCLATNPGCNGGSISNGYAVINANPGSVPNSLYPYTSGFNASYGACIEKDYTPISIKVNFTYVNETDEALISALVLAPVAATIQVSTTSAGDFFYYSSGIMNATDPNICGPSTNHAILVTGYGVNATTGEAYWIIKNSWGTGWGVNGYGQISRTTLNACGLTLGATAVTCK